MNRHERRAQAAERGIPWHVVRRTERLLAAERAALRLSPERAREILARWAARRDHTQAEVDRLNGQSQETV